MDPYNDAGQQPPPPMMPPPSPSPQFDIQKIVKSFTTPDWLIAGGAIAFLIASLLPWYTVSENVAATAFTGAVHSSYSINAWAYGPGTFAGILAIATLAFFGARLAGVKLPPTVPEKWVYVGLGGVIALLSLLFWQQTSSVDSAVGLFGATSGFSAGPSFGLFIGLIAGIAIAAGGYLKKA